MMHTKGYNFTISGFVWALILIAMFSTMFAIGITDLNDSFSVSGEDVFANYSNKTTKIRETVESTRNSTNINPETGVLDVIGGFFRSGYAAMKVSVQSMDLFYDITSEAGKNVGGLSLFMPYIYMIVVVAIIIGVVIAVLVKMRV